MYFCTQNPAYIPQNILRQIGNRVQHALRTYTPKDRKALLEAERAKRTEERQRKAHQGFLGDLIDQVGKSATRQIGNEIGRTITRSIFGAFFGKKR